MELKIRNEEDDIFKEEFLKLTEDKDGRKQ